MPNKMNLLSTGHAPTSELGFCSALFPAKDFFFNDRELFDGKEGKKTPSVDCGAGPHTKDNGPPEEARIAYRREAEAHRRRNPAKGI
jgi:hypothetical protein